MAQINGVYTSLITPFDDQNRLDEDGLRLLIQMQLKNNIDGIVPLGTTGEAPTLDESEKKRILAIVIEEVKGRIPVMAGTGTYSTQETIKCTRQAQDLGADCALVIAPYYNRPTQNGLYLHFKALAEASNIPIIIYNHPGRTGVNLQHETLKKLMAIPSIIGLKETSGNISQIMDYIELARNERPDFSIVSGDDALIFPLMAAGGHGVICVLSNLIPEEIKLLTSACQSGNYTEAREMHYNLFPLFKAMSLESNPMPIKAALNLAGLPAGKCRSPLCELTKENHDTLKSILSRYPRSESETVGVRTIHKSY